MMIGFAISLSSITPSFAASTLPLTARHSRLCPSYIMDDTSTHQSDTQPPQQPSDSAGVEAFFAPFSALQDESAQQPSQVPQEADAAPPTQNAEEPVEEIPRVRDSLRMEEDDLQHEMEQVSPLSHAMDVTDPHSKQPAGG